MTAFPKYPAYRDSGVEWLGDVPEHWEANRVFSIFNERVETGHSQLPILNITISNGVQVEQFEGERKKRLIEDRDAYKRAAAGDIAYNTMRMWQGAVGDVPVDGLVSPAYVVARPIKSINPRYYSYLFRGETFKVETNRHSYGIVSDRNRLYWLGFKNIVVPIPPRAEQDRIVAFLDEKTAQIDALIAKKQRQIELLDEQKAILINRAVTRGLHPNPDLQDSGIPWIGPIPKQWALKKLKFIASINPTVAFNRGEKVTFLPMERVNVDGAPSYSEPVDAKTLTLSLTAFQRGDVLLAKITPCFENGKGADLAGLPTRTGLGSTEFHVLRPRLVTSQYLRDMTSAQSWRQHAEGFMQGSAGQKRVTTDYLANSVFPVPPPREQAAISQRVDSLRSMFKTATQLFESQIQTLQTLRGTLIAHAVTGKIKVS